MHLARAIGQGGDRPDFIHHGGEAHIVHMADNEQLRHDFAQRGKCVEHGGSPLAIERAEDFIEHHEADAVATALRQQLREADAGGERGDILLATGKLVSREIAGRRRCTGAARTCR